MADTDPDRGAFLARYAGQPSRKPDVKPAAAPQTDPPASTVSAGADVDDVLTQLRAAALRKWTDEGNQRYSLFGRAADRIETLTREVAELRAEAERLRGDPDDGEERGSVYWFGEAQRWKALASQINTDWMPANRKLSEQLAASEAALREAREDAERYRWLRTQPFHRWKRIGWHVCEWFAGIANERDKQIDAARAATKEAT